MDSNFSIYTGVRHALRVASLIRQASIVPCFIYIILRIPFVAHLVFLPLPHHVKPEPYLLKSDRGLEANDSSWARLP